MYIFYFSCTVLLMLFRQAISSRVIVVSGDYNILVKSVIRSKNLARICKCVNVSSFTSEFRRLVDCRFLIDDVKCTKRVRTNCFLQKFEVIQKEILFKLSECFEFLFAFSIYNYDRKEGYKRKCLIHSLAVIIAISKKNWNRSLCRNRPLYEIPVFTNPLGEGVKCSASQLFSLGHLQNNLYNVKIPINYFNLE